MAGYTSFLPKEMPEIFSKSSLKSRTDMKKHRMEHFGKNKTKIFFNSVCVFVTRVQFSEANVSVADIKRKCAQMRVSMDFKLNYELTLPQRCGIIFYNYICEHLR